MRAYDSPDLRIGCRCRRPVPCYTDNPGIRWRKRLCGRPRCGGVTGCRAWTQRAVPFSTASTTRKHRLKSPLTPSLSFDVKIAIGLPLTSTQAYFPPIYMSCLCEHMTPPTCALGAGAGALSPATPTTPVSDGGSGSAGARGAAASPAAGRGRHGGNPRPPPHPIHLSPPYAPALWPLSSRSCRTARVAGGVDGGDR